MSQAPTARLDRLLANMGYGSRGDIDKLAKAGRITFDGTPLKKADQRVTLSPALAESLKIDGKPVDPLPGLVLLINKPLGVTCSHKETGPLVYAALPERWRRRDPQISTIGRLDKETSGLLLMTDDGAFLHRVISPKAEVSKRYRATLARPLAGNEGEIFASGTLMLEGEEKPLLPAVFEAISDNEGLITITEGRYHQVRRMFAAIGNHVDALHREAIGGLSLPADLEQGSYRIMTEADMAAVFAKH